MNPRLLKSWSRRSAVVFTLASGNVGMMIRELLRNHGWRVALSTDDFSEMSEAVKHEQADIIIIDDDLDMPSSTIARRVMADPIMSLMPTLAFISDQNRNERLALSRLGRPEIVGKPLTPDKFIPGFDRLVTRWSAGIYLPIRKASELLIQGREDAGIALLKNISQYEVSHPLVLPSLAHFIAKQNSPKEAEKLLIGSLQGKSRDLSIVYALVDLYLNYSMPSLALRLLKTVFKSYVKPDCITPDLIQTAFIMNNLSEGIDLLKELRQRNPENRVITRFLCRALFAEGRVDEFRKLASRNHSLVRYEEEWGPKKGADDDEFNQAS